MKKLKVMIAIFAGTLLVTALTAADAKGTRVAQSKGTVAEGKALFEQCQACHNPDSDEKKVGPGLKGLFKKDKMSNGKKPTEANVRAVLDEGGNGMPPYKELLTDEERDHIMAYLKTL